MKKYGGEEICEELLRISMGDEKSLLEEIMTLLAPGHNAEPPSGSLSMFPAYAFFLSSQLGGLGIYALDGLWLLLLLNFWIALPYL